MSIGFVCQTANTAYKVYDSSLNTLYSGTLTGGIGWFAADQTNDCFYVSENAVLTKRSLSDGTLLATQFESVGAQRPCVVDANGNLWSIDDSVSNVIRKWNSDLTARTDYTLKAGVLAGLVYNLCLSYDNNYIWLLGWDSEITACCVIAKISIANLDGGDPEWTYTEAYSPIYSLVSDENDNIYFGYNNSITYHSDDGYYTYNNVVQKVNSSGSGQWASVHRGGTLVCYDETRTVVYANYFEDSRTTIRRYSEINLSGSVLTKTTELTNSTFASECYIFDDYLVGFVGTTRIHLIDISSGIAESENSVANVTVAYGTAMGDPTGYIHNRFGTPPVAAFSGTPRTGNAPLTVTFTDSSTGSPTSWAWDFGDSEASTDQNPEHTYNSAGVYTVALTVTNGAGSDTETKTNYIDVHDGNVESMLDELAMRLEDAEQRAFPETVKLKALHRGQLGLTKFIADNFVPELQTIHSDLDCSSGEIALSSLTYNVLKDKEGIVGVRVTIDSVDYWAVEIEPMEVDRLENEYFYADDEVLYYVQNSKIKIVAHDLTGATADVFYIKLPTAFTVYQSPDLQEYFYNLILCLAEDYCYRIEGRYDRAQTAKNMALREIGLLNRKYEEQQQLLSIGIYIDDWS